MSMIDNVTFPAFNVEIPSKAPLYVQPVFLICTIILFTISIYALFLNYVCFKLVNSCVSKMPSSIRPLLVNMDITYIFRSVSTLTHFVYNICVYMNPDIFVPMKRRHCTLLSSLFMIPVRSSMCHVFMIIIERLFVAGRPGLFDATNSSLTRAVE